MGKPAAGSGEKVTGILHGATELVLGIQEQRAAWREAEFIDT